MVGFRVAAFSGDGGSTDGIGLTGTVSAWVTILMPQAWVDTRPPGTFNDQGGLIITFLILALTLVAWLVGGPIASTLALTATRLARLLTWTRLAVVGDIFARELTSEQIPASTSGSWGCHPPAAAGIRAGNNQLHYFLSFVQQIY